MHEQTQFYYHPIISIKDSNIILIYSKKSQYSQHFLIKYNMNQDQVLKLCIYPKSYYALFRCGILLGTELHQSHRIFRNSKTNSYKYITFQDAKKGKIPLKDHHLVISIDIDGATNKKIVKFDTSRSKKQVFMVLRKQLIEGLKYHSLTLGRTIKYYFQQFKVVSSNTIPNKETQQLFDFRRGQTSFYFKDSASQGICKICYDGQNCQNDMLITPCLCKGSCASVHFGCLKTWIQNKVVVLKSNSKITSLSFQRYYCQICKAQLPKCIIYKGSEYFLFRQNFTSKPYIIIQDLHSDIWHIITLKQNEKLSIGRSRCSDLQIYNHQADENQSQIIYKHGQYCIRDLQSQNGTLISIKKPFEVTYPVEVNFDNTTFYFSNQPKQ